MTGLIEGFRFLAEILKKAVLTYNMKSRSIGVVLLAILISIAAIVCEPRLVAANGGRPPLLTVQVVRAPDPRVAFGNGYLAYELALTSYDSSPIKVVGLRVIDADAPNRRAGAPR